MGKTELAAGGLAISIFHVAGLSIIFGLFTASETLFSQTFGGSNKFRLGVQVQRAIVILTFCCFPCWAVYIIIEPILLAVSQWLSKTVLTLTFSTYYSLIYIAKC
uniref:Multidrug and toxin extrusion protein 2 n=1 Tax=Echinococcus granulosus TaxID=6210 RepID=A0A068WG20_ECHGR|nr:multidrug and toxin extrusion protein 2 [Echinococcus granulosus]